MPPPATSVTLYFIPTCATIKLPERVRGTAVTVTEADADLVGSAALVAVMVAVELAVTVGD